MLLAVGIRLPEWAKTACDDYAKRLRGRLPLVVVEVPPGRRSASQPVERAMAEEAKRLLAAVRPQDHLALLDEHGSAHDSPALSRWLAGRMRAGNDLVLAIGGPDGFAPEVRARAQESVSLSRLTLPHALARVVLIEQLYRAVTLMDGHPYHRE